MVVQLQQDVVTWIQSGMAAKNQTVLSQVGCNSHWPLVRRQEQQPTSRYWAFMVIVSLMAIGINISIYMYIYILYIYMYMFIFIYSIYICNYIYISIYIFNNILYIYTHSLYIYCLCVQIVGHIIYVHVNI